jgi:hypothetical protein
MLFPADLGGRNVDGTLASQRPNESSALVRCNPTVCACGFRMSPSLSVFVAKVLWNSGWCLATARLHHRWSCTSCIFYALAEFSLLCLPIGCIENRRKGQWAWARAGIFGTISAHFWSDL